MNRLLALLTLLCLTGCASMGDPDFFVEGKGVVQHNKGSDWVLNPDREWIHGENNPRLHVRVGLEWEHNLDFPYIATGTDELRWFHIGFAKGFGSYDPLRKFNWCGQIDIVHQVDSLTSSILSTDMKAWQGHNPFWHFRGGLCLRNKVKLMLATGRSVFQGAPFESEDMAPDLYWTHVELSKRWGGK